jgi:hypothetical protein
MRKQLLYFLVSVFGWVSPNLAFAQFIGYTAPQTEQQVLATNQACTGSAQVYPIKNLGQTQHYLSISSLTGQQTFHAEIDAIDVQGGIYPISDAMETAGGASSGIGTVAASGYFPKIQVSITCGPNTATYNASYSGAWGTFNTNTGTYLQAQIDKVIFNAIPGNSNQVRVFIPPFGNSLGTVYFSQTGTVTTAGTISILCETTAGNYTVSTLSPTTSTSIQAFSVPSVACPLLSVAYVPGGSTATAIILEYVFSVPATQPISGTITANQGTSPWVTNVSQFGGNNVVTGTGTSGAGVPRVTVSSDSSFTTTPSLSATILSGQQAVTNSATALATTTLAHGLCVQALSTNAHSVFIGPTGVTTSTGLELPAKSSTCLSVSNANAVFVVDASGGDTVTWVGN